MSREITVLLIEDDFYARSWMEMLVRRDWRTRAVGQVSNPLRLPEFLQGLQKFSQKLDAAFIDTDIPNNQHWLKQTLQDLQAFAPKIRFILTGVMPNPDVAGLVMQPEFAPNFGGYILKDEICYAQTWAVLLAMRGKVAVTPGVVSLFDQERPLPPGALMLDGRNAFANFTVREAEAARLAFIFSMERRDLADELGISEDYTFGLVSALYEKMGLNQVLNGEWDAKDYFGNHPTVLAHLEQTLEQLRRTRSKKAQDKETLAFHFLTYPEITEIN
ncbi:MAG TPA: hypothetical protein PKM21_09905 [Anaerolineales bacterium]|nr:hypothetical protein [Anaerolineales bacterium]